MGHNFAQEHPDYITFTIIMGNKLFILNEEGIDELWEDYALWIYIYAVDALDAVRYVIADDDDFKPPEIGLIPALSLIVKLLFNSTINHIVRYYKSMFSEMSTKKCQQKKLVLVKMYERWLGWMKVFDFVSGASNGFRKEADFDWKGLEA